MVPRHSVRHVGVVSRQQIWEWAMTSAPSSGTLVTILPCNDLDASERFYNRLGFVRRAESGDPDYRILSNRAGGHLHLTRAEKGWLVPGRNPFGLYLYLEDVDGLAAALQDSALEDADQRTSHGECMNLQFQTRMRRLCASAGRAAFAIAPTR